MNICAASNSSVRVFFKALFSGRGFFHSNHLFAASTEASVNEA